jgi:hypothetical protein
MPVCDGVGGGWEPRWGLEANATFACFGGRPRFRGLPPSSGFLVSGAVERAGGVSDAYLHPNRQTARRRTCCRESDCASGRAQSRLGTELASAWWAERRV